MDSALVAERGVDWDGQCFARRSQRTMVSGPLRPERLPREADGFTKGWVGVPPHAKRTARTTSQEDRDNQTPPWNPPSNTSGQQKALCGFEGNVRTKRQNSAVKNPP